MRLNRTWSSTVNLVLWTLLFLVSSPALTQVPGHIRVSIKALNRPLHAVLDDLSGQCGYNFTFDSRLIDSRGKVTMNLKNITIEQAIDTLFPDPGLTYHTIKRNIVIYPSVSRADRDTIRAAPSMLTVHGNITDQLTGRPLAYATLSVFDTYLGTISNEEGRFTLQIPDTLAQPVIVSSFIGYRNQYTPVSIRSEKQLKIRMDKNLISLQEVIIRYHDPVSLLSATIEKINENFMSEPAAMQAYYRENVTRNDKSMLFTETVAEIAKAPYTSSLFAERTRILKGRKISNINQQDTVILKIRSGLNTMLQLDIIKHPPAFLSPDFSVIYDLNFSDVVSFRDHLVYVISFEPKKNLEDIYFMGDIYIDQETLAIVAADFHYDPERLSREEDMFVARKSRSIRIRPVSAMYHVEYKESDHGFHLSMVQGEVRFKVRKKRQWIASRYQINLDMAITHVDPGNPPQIRLGQQLKYSSVLSDQVFEYDPEFWGGYNTIRPEASLTEALQLIEHSMQEISGND
ncbi:MAG: carboxypeptidase-like regulatory domain-containing protein [Bacteroidales bacterium]|nr:carboxypeptidase-like regulatory domain-containing protein [Bacteroidales bacterium]